MDSPSCRKTRTSTISAFCEALHRRCSGYSWETARRPKWKLCFVPALPTSRCLRKTFRSARSYCVDRGVADGRKNMDFLAPSLVEALGRHGAKIHDAYRGPWVGVAPKVGVGVSFNPKVTIDSETLRLLATIPHPRLIWVSFADTVIATDLAPLRDIGDLRALALNNTNFFEKGGVLPELKNLRWLSFFQTQATDRDLKGLAQLPQLEQLFVGVTNVTHEGVRELAKCRTLRYLDLEGNKITDEVLKAASALKDLEGLNIAGRMSEVSDEGVNALLALRHLRLLGFLEGIHPPPSISAAALERLRSIPGLNWVRGGCAFVYRPKDHKTYFF
jgi:hypothetical protein